MKRVLMLPYYFPPANSGGVVRTTKFVKYLRDFDWDSTVVAPEWNVSSQEDTGFAAELPADLRVHRAGVAEQNGLLWDALDAVPYAWRWFRRIRQGVQFPDQQSAWGHAALGSARRAIQEECPAVLYSTSPPVTSHWVAMRLKEETGLPWVADFRDPWTDNRIGYLNPWQWRRRIDLRFERRIYAMADCVIANTQANRDVMIERHGASAAKVVTIPNGYDEADFAGLTPHQPSERFRILHAGCFCGSPQVFLTAFHELLRRHASADVVLSLAGDSSNWGRKCAKDLAIQGHIECLGYVTHSEICRLLVQSDLLLHVYPPGLEYSVPSKLFEYFRSGRPILAVSDRPSEVARLLEETGSGKTFRHDEVAALSDYLDEAYRAWRSGRDVGATTADERIRRFSRREQTRQLAGIFDTIINSARHAPRRDRELRQNGLT